VFNNYLVSALRSLVRNKLFGAINVIGLGVGLAACALIILFVKHEFSYDNQFTDVERLYRIEATANIPGRQSNASPNFFGATFDLLPGDYEEVESIVRMQQRGGTVIKGETATPETFTYVDPGFLTMFDFDLIEGERDGILDAPGMIVLTEEMAIKHLGEGPWLGRTVTVNHIYLRELKVTGVLKNLPGNTHFKFDFLMGIDKLTYAPQLASGSTDLDRWNGLPFGVYIKLKPGRSIESMAASIDDWVDKYFPAQIQALVGIKGSELFTPRLMPVRDIHMFSPVQFDMRPPGKLSVIVGFGGISLLILVIACINFMNLATAASTLRAREVALRKVMGANRKQLFIQFEIESLIPAFAGLLFAMVAIELILPTFSEYTDRQLSSASMTDPVVLSMLVGLAMVVGLLSGLHPALIMSGFRPGKILQSNQSETGISSGLRSTLVLFQFMISAALIIITLLVYIQTDYARSVNLGYDNSNQLTVRGVGRQQEAESLETLTNVITKLPGVRSVSLSSFTPGDGPNTGLSLRVPGVSERLIIFYRSVYPRFFSQFDVQPVAGRLLSDEFAGDRATFVANPNVIQEQQVNVVINEAAVRILGFGSPQEAISKVYYRGSENEITSTIVGVIPNVHFGSPRAQVDGEIYMYLPDQVTDLLVSFDPDEFQSVSGAIEEKVAAMFPRIQTRIQHLQDNIADQYREEKVQSTLLAMFSGLAIVIACMGLFGLASLTIARRTREIGVRKVMGASSREIVALLLMQFSKPVLIANIIAWPFCWYAVNQWLDRFEYRIELLPWFLGIILLAIIATLLLAWVTVATHAFKVSRASPIFALRYE